MFRVISHSIQFNRLYYNIEGECTKYNKISMIDPVGKTSEFKLASKKVMLSTHWESIL